MMTFKGQKLGLGNASLAAAGTEEQKKKWGNTLLAMANTEPGCGSDSKAIETTAVLDGDDWVLNGEKIFVTSESAVMRLSYGQHWINQKAGGYKGVCCGKRNAWFYTLQQGKENGNSCQ